MLVLLDNTYRKIRNKLTTKYYYYIVKRKNVKVHHVRAMCEADPNAINLVFKY